MTRTAVDAYLKSRALKNKRKAKKSGTGSRSKTDSYNEKTTRQRLDTRNDEQESLVEVSAKQSDPVVIEMSPSRQYRLDGQSIEVRSQIIQDIDQNKQNL